MYGCGWEYWALAARDADARAAAVMILVRGRTVRFAKRILDLIRRSFASPGVAFDPRVSRMASLAGDARPATLD